MRKLCPDVREELEQAHTPVAKASSPGLASWPTCHPERNLMDFYFILYEGSPLLWIGVVLADTVSGMVQS